MNKQLDDLPATNDEFWQEAEVHTNLTTFSQEEAQKEVRANKDKHFFIRVPGHQAQCTHCDWGFQLDRGDKIKNGHLYDKDGTLVI